MLRLRDRHLEDLHAPELLSLGALDLGCLAGQNKPRDDVLADLLREAHPFGCWDQLRCVVLAPEKDPDIDIPLPLKVTAGDPVDFISRPRNIAEDHVFGFFVSNCSCCFHVGVLLLFVVKVELLWVKRCWSQITSFLEYSRK
ncbi:MAG: hypothetical protein BWY42_01552 [Candidatus Omnitrophica bacterium ADurb.Bin277]|nr:MAG: hypothetical protein BWY42_01552 [Candidatus Omnitrophica bacterium ADurb.Bin277]